MSVKRHEFKENEKDKKIEQLEQKNETLESNLMSMELAMYSAFSLIDGIIIGGV